MSSGKKGQRVFVVGVGMTKFEKPGRKDWDYPDMGRLAGERALRDAGITYDMVQQVCVGYCYGDRSALSCKQNAHFVFPSKNTFSFLSNSFLRIRCAAPADSARCTNWG